MLTLLALILADATAASASQIGIWILVLAALSPIASVVIGIISARRTPPIAEEIAKALANYVPRVEHDEELSRVHDRIDKTNEDVTAVRNMVGKTFGDVERAIGKLEGTTRALENTIARNPPPRHGH